MSTYTTEDVLAWAAHKAIETLDWASDSLGSKGIDTEMEEFDALDAARRDLVSAAKLTARYSDGRPIQSRIDIETGVYYTHIWPYRATNLGERLLFASRRSADPGEDNGTYNLFVDESKCSMRVELVDPQPRHLRGV